MDTLVASQIFVGLSLIAWSLSSVKRLYVWIPSLLVLMFGPSWFAYVTGLWPFYSYTFFSILWFAHAATVAAKEAKRDAQVNS